MTMTLNIFFLLSMTLRMIWHLRLLQLQSFWCVRKVIKIAGSVEDRGVSGAMVFSFAPPSMGH